MGDKSKIEWTDASWTPIRARNLKTGKIGWHCEHATTGCEFCYAEGMNKRLGTGLPFKPGHRKDIEIFLDEKMLLAPLRWKKPRMVFVCSMTDAFADFVKDEWLDKIFAVMALCPQHTFQVLTKRAVRMRDYCASDATLGRVVSLSNSWLQADGHCEVIHHADGLAGIILPNIWLGVSCERQQEADERIPLLLQTPAAVKFISAEPLIGPIDLHAMPFTSGDPRHRWDALTGQALMYGSGVNGNPDMTIRVEKPIFSKLDWVIVGGESGSGARPMPPQWARELRDQCAEAGVPFFFKQWGQYAPYDRGRVDSTMLATPGSLDTPMQQFGKKLAGRLLDGREHNAFPKSAASRSPVVTQPSSAETVVP